MPYKRVHTTETTELSRSWKKKFLKQMKWVTQTPSYLGDWISVVGAESYRNIVGLHGLGRKNLRDQMYINFCETNALIFTSKWFR